MWGHASQEMVCSLAHCDARAFFWRLPPRSEAMCFAGDRRDVQRNGVARSNSINGLQEQESRKSREFQSSLRAILVNRPSDSNELLQHIQCNEMCRAKSTRKCFDSRDEKGSDPLQY